MIKFGNISNCLAYFQEFLNNTEQVSDTVTLTLKKADQPDCLAADYDKDKAGLLLGLLASDDRLTELAVFALIKVMSEMKEEDVKEMIAFLYGAVKEAKDAMEEVAEEASKPVKTISLNVRPSGVPS